MKNILITLIAALLITIPVYGEKTISGDEREVTFEDAKNSNGIMLFAENVAETELYYDQLTSYEQNYYKDLESNIMSLTDGTTTYRYSTSVQIDKGLTTVDEVWESLWSKMGIDISTYIYRPVYALSYLDKPQYFWLDINRLSGGYGFSNYNPSTGIIGDFYINLKVKSGETAYYPSAYTSQAEVEADYTGIMNKANEIIADAPKGSSDWGKLNYYMNWFKDNCQYNSDLTTASTKAYLPASALLYGKEGIYAPVCEGYSEALKILCDLSGIKAMCTESFYTVDGVLTGHKWNLVKLNNKFYHCDPTWFDSYTSLGSYRYLMTGSQNMAAYDTSQNHTIVYQMKFYAPEISATDYLNDMGINGYNVLNVDGNTVINQIDTVMLMRRLSGIVSGTLKDVNNDSKYDINDAVIMQKLMF